MSGPTIVLIPDDPAALLMCGPCGMRPPMMIRGPTRDPGVLSEWVPFLPEHWGDPDNYASTRCTLALVLAFDGVVLPAGCLFALPIEEHGHDFLRLIINVRAVLAGSTMPLDVEGWALEVVDG